METIAKFIKALFFGSDGEVEMTTVLKFKRVLTYILLGGVLTIAALCYWADEEEDDSNDTNIEYVDDTINEVN